MTKVTIRLQLAENVKKFIDIVSKFPCDVDLVSGRYIVDAKSVLGIFSLDLSQPIELHIYDEKCDHLVEQIRDFMEN